MTAQPGNQGDLLDAASEVLQGNGFEVKSEGLRGTSFDWVLAESDLFVVAVTAAQDLAGLREVESFAVPELLERVAKSEAGAKRWDAYLVLVTSTEATEPDDARALVDIEHDTRGVRRLVEVALEPTPDELRRVLRPFMPLPPAAEEGLASAFDDLEEQLVVNGVAADAAHRVVAVWQDRGHLNEF